MRQEKKNKGRRADLRWLLLLVELLEATGSGAGGSRWFSFSSSSLFFYSLSLLCFFVLFSASSSSSFRSSPLSYPLSSLFFLLVSPVFIGKIKGRERSGRLLCCRPSTARGTHLLPFLQHVESFRQVGILGEEWLVKLIKKNILIKILDHWSLITPFILFCDRGLRGLLYHVL